MRKLRRPACAIIMPLSMQNLSRDYSVCPAYQAQNRPFVSSKHLSTSFFCHNGHHLLEPHIAFTNRELACDDVKSKQEPTADATDNQNLFTSDVSHGAFRYFHKHGEDGLLQRE